MIKDSGKEIEILIKLSQDIKSEGDIESQCKNYPFENYLNYNECDQTFLQNLLQDEIDATPFWASQDLDNVTKIRQVDHNFFANGFYHIIL